MTDYVLKVGADGAGRLDQLDAHLGPYSRRFLLDAGLAAGMRVLDLGCGNGNMAAWMAQVVGPAGAVVAADIDPQQLGLVRGAMAAAGVGNVEVIEADASRLALGEGVFDLAYCRCLLMHLREPAAALERMFAAVKRGGLVVCEEPASSSVATYPGRVPVIHALNQAFVAMGLARGLDFDIGDRLHELLVRPGSSVVTARFVQPIVPLASAAAFLELGARELRTIAVRSGMITEAEASAALRDLEALKEAGKGYYAFPRQAQVAVRVDSA